MTSDSSEFAQETDLMSSPAFDSLYHKHKYSVFGFAYYLTQNKGEAEDLFQETWLRVVQNLQKISNMRTFKAWVFTITANLYRDALRKKKIRRLFFLQKSKKSYLSPGTSPFISEMEQSNRSNELDQVDMGVAISQAMAKLPDRQRLVFVLKEIEGFKQSEISEILRLPVGTVKSLIYRAVKRLQRELWVYKPK